MKKTEKAAVKETPVKAAVKTAAAAVKKEETKEAAVKKAPEKKAPAKRAAVRETIYLQYLGKEISNQELVKQVKEVWTKQLKRKVGEIKSITIYLKPEENAAYYVVNDEVKGSIDL